MPQKMAQLQPSKRSNEAICTNVRAIFMGHPIHHMASDSLHDQESAPAKKWPLYFTVGEINREIHFSGNCALNFTYPNIDFHASGLSVFLFEKSMLGGIVLYCPKINFSCRWALYFTPAEIEIHASTSWSCP